MGLTLRSFHLPHNCTDDQPWPNDLMCRPALLQQPFAEHSGVAAKCKVYPQDNFGNYHNSQTYMHTYIHKYIYIHVFLYYVYIFIYTQLYIVQELLQAPTKCHATMSIPEAGLFMVWDLHKPAAWPTLWLNLGHTNKWLAGWCGTRVYLSKKKLGIIIPTDQNGLIFFRRVSYEFV